MFRDATITRLRERVAALQARFAKSLEAFERARLFSGPSVYFHKRTLEHLRNHKSAADAVADDSYLEALYATLTAWGLHRMGPGNAKLLDFDDMRRNLRRCADLIRALESYHISTLDPLNVQQITRKLCTLLDQARVSQARTFLVSSTKAIHHLLPSLVPPVDHEYTLSFFFHNIILDGDNDQEVFSTIFPYFHEVAQRNAEFIRDAVGRGEMNTSETKIIDNAIVGYCLGHAV